MSRRGFVAAAGLGLLAAASPLAGCATGPPSLPDPFRLATGPPGAVYREIGRVLAEVLGRSWPDRRIEVLHTDAGVENAGLLLAGQTELGLTNIDIVEERGPELVALARLFDSVVHLVVTEDSGVRSIRDLDGRPVASGLPESGSRFVVTRLAEALGIELVFEDFSQADSVEAIRSGRVDAVLSLTGMPTPAVTRLAVGGGVRLLDLGDDLEPLFDAYPLSYAPVVIPGSMYPPLAGVRTFAVPTLLAAHRSLPRDLAKFVTGAVFENAAELSRVRPEAGQINPRTGAATVPVALHPGAEDWFREQKP